MIIGLGSDLVDIRRIENTLLRFGDRFVQRVFTQTEQKKSDKKARRAASYAKRFAAKEACFKALGVGRNSGIFWRDMGVKNLPSGQPALTLTGEALGHLRRLTPAGMAPMIHLTMADEALYAQAHVVIEAIPKR